MLIWNRPYIRLVAFNVAKVVYKIILISHFLWDIDLVVTSA